MMYFGYLAAGGEDGDKILKTSMAMELLHSFLLIHDDIIDKDASRHGVETIHERYKKIGKKYSLTKDSQHFGNSMAIISGDMAASMSCEIIFNSDFSSDIIIKALDKLQKIVFVTIPGEMIDVIMSYTGEATEEQILRMHEGKTARYTCRWDAFWLVGTKRCSKVFPNILCRSEKPFRLKMIFWEFLGMKRRLESRSGRISSKGSKRFWSARL